MKKLISTICLLVTAIVFVVTTLVVKDNGNIFLISITTLMANAAIWAYLTMNDLEPDKK
jgi:hypothetical protein